MLGEKKSFDFVVNALNIKADYYEEDIEKIFIPLIKKLKNIQEEKKRRIIVYMAAPPGIGKSTLSMFLEYISSENKELSGIQSVGMDGFHHKREYIKSHNAFVDGKEVPMSKVKGCPETFDVDKLKSKLNDMRNNNILWPVYDRKIHDVLDDKIKITGEIVIVEGNWLLLDEEGWKELAEYCDYSIFIKGNESMLKDRLINRKILGGLSADEACEFYENSDRKNIHRALSNRKKADLEIELLNEGKYINRR